MLGDPAKPPAWAGPVWPLISSAIEPLIKPARNVPAVPSSGQPDFTGSEMWAPSRAACQRNRQAPDIYFAIRNEQSRHQRQVSFNPVVLLAVAQDQDSQIIQQGRMSAEAAAEIIGAILRLRCVRPWGYRLGPGFTGAIGDLTTSGLFKPGPRHQGRPSPSLLKGDWEGF